MKEQTGKDKETEETPHPDKSRFPEQGGKENEKGKEVPEDEYEKSGEN